MQSTLPKKCFLINKVYFHRLGWSQVSDDPRSKENTTPEPEKDSCPASTHLAAPGHRMVQNKALGPTILQLSNTQAQLSILKAYPKS